MKGIFLVLSITFATVVNAQQTYVPDNNFEAFLEGNGMGNGVPNDDYVLTANISGVSSLIVWGYNIADLTGVEDFASLTQLYCFDNNLSALDVTQNTLLSDLRCYNNNLSSLDVTQNPLLSTLLCFSNNLVSLDVTQNSNLNELSCYSNFITSLDVSQNPSLTNLTCNNNQLSALDVSQNTSLVTLRCYSNDITSLDVSQFTSLTQLFCYNNELTSLDVSQTTALVDLRCFGNEITSLNLAQSAPLELLMCNDNLLESLDVSSNSFLVDMYCQQNELICLNANNGVNISMDCSDNQLDCISVVNPGWSNTNATYDPGVNFQILCDYSIDNDVDQVGTMLTAVQNNATYQWLDCDISDGAINGETNQSYTPTTTGYYAVEITYSNPCGGVYIDTSSCHYVDYSGLEELSTGEVELLKITDLMGRQTPFKPNTPLIYYYSDGSIERVFKIEE